MKETSFKLLDIAREGEMLDRWEGVKLEALSSTRHTVYLAQLGPWSVTMYMMIPK
jgi:hypothetical protein